MSDGVVVVVGGGGAGLDGRSLLLVLGTLEVRMVHVLINVEWRECGGTMRIQQLPRENYVPAS